MNDTCQLVLIKKSISKTISKKVIYKVHECHKHQACAYLKSVSLRMRLSSHSLTAHLCAILTRITIKSLDIVKDI